MRGIRACAEQLAGNATNAALSEDAQFSDALRRLIVELDKVMDDRETSVPGEPVEPEPIRGTTLYEAEQAVERHYPAGKLPVEPWRAWRGMLIRADEQQGEDDPHERYERFYELCDALRVWTVAEITRLEPTDQSLTPKKTKRSTVRGEGRAKLIAALTKHHEYADGGCLNSEPIGNNELARQADVAKRTASSFFSKEFHGHAKYQALCNDSPRLVAALKALNGEFRPHEFYDSRAPDDLEQEDE
jgi:hypothetical protein